MIGRGLDLTLGTLARQLPLLVGVGFVLLLAFILGQRLGLFGQRIELAASSLASLEPDAARSVTIYSLLPKDGIRSIDEPRFLAAAVAADQMAASELVIGVVIEGEARAYPINVLSRHEIVNDVVGGVPVAVTYCPLCFSGIVFDRRVEGELLEFGVSGKLVMNDLVMYDRQTDSLWQQLLGEGIRRRFKGVRLEILAASHTSWSSWLAAQPDTLVLDKGGGYRSDSYAGYYDRNDRGVIPGSGADDRLPGKALVLGLVIDDEPRAYTFDALSAVAVVNDRLGSLDTLVVFDARSTTAVAFDRSLDGRSLSFTAAAAGSLRLVDAETGSVWSALTGEAIAGALAGRTLRQLPATYAFWFAWSDFYRTTDLYTTAAGAAP